MLEGVAGLLEDGNLGKTFRILESGEHGGDAGVVLGASSASGFLFATDEKSEVGRCLEQTDALETAELVGAGS